MLLSSHHAIITQWPLDLPERHADNEVTLQCVIAATILVVWSHPGRIRSESAFARLAGVAPIPASSGATTRYRLSRGGDRALNRALYTAVLSRLRCDAETRAYAARQRARGKTSKEIIRQLKRYLARRVYRLLQAHPHSVLPVQTMDS